MKRPTIYYYKDGLPMIKEYRVEGMLHRDPVIGPACIRYYENGNKRFEQYCINGILQRNPEIGPAVIWYDENEQVIRKEYWFNDKLHNPYGPAWSHYDYDVFEWWFNRIDYTKKVNEYLKKNDLNYKNMVRIDFDIMWTCIL